MLDVLTWVPHIHGCLSDVSAASLQHMVTFLIKTAQHEPLAPFNWHQEYLFQQELHGMEGRPLGAAAAGSSAAAAAAAAEQQCHHGPQWALLRFEQPLTAPTVSCGRRLCSLHLAALMG